MPKIYQMPEISQTSQCGLCLKLNQTLWALFLPQIWFYTNNIFENAGIPTEEIPYTTAGTGIIEIISALIGVNVKIMHVKSENG